MSAQRPTLEIVYQCLDCRMRYVSETYPTTRHCICGGALLFRRDLSIDMLLRSVEPLVVLEDRLRQLQEIET